jgi:Leucine-rich repeat (LRR) protein
MNPNVELMLECDVEAARAMIFKALSLELEKEIVFFPLTFDHVADLTQLDLSFCDLHTLSPQIGSFVGLASLNLSNNRLVSLPESLSNLSSLLRLNLHGNDFTVIPSFLQDSGKLELIL